MLEQLYQLIDGANISEPLINFNNLDKFFDLPRGHFEVVEALNLDAKIIRFKGPPATRQLVRPRRVPPVLRRNGTAHVELKH